MELFAAWLVVIAVELVTPPVIKPASWTMRTICVDTFEGEWVPDPVNGNKMCTKGPIGAVLRVHALKVRQKRRRKSDICRDDEDPYQ